MSKQWLKQHWPIVMVLAVTLATYAWSVGNGFVTLDDPSLVYENPIVLSPTAKNIGKAFSSYDPELYVPLTMFSYQLESELLGMAPWHFHLVNLLLHMISVCLVYSIVQRICAGLQSPSSAIADARAPSPTGRGPGRGHNWIPPICALLFAIHPLNSEAVLWISARKDVLSSMFFLASVLMYLRYTHSPNMRRFWLCLGLFALALLSKVTAVTLPVTLLLIDWLQGRRDKCVLSEKVPFFVLSAVFVIIAVVGKTHIIEDESFISLLLMAPRSVVFYLGMLMLPANQAALHLYERAISIASPDILLSMIIVLGVTALCWYARRWNKLVFFGWAWFLVTLAPTFMHYSRGGQFIMLASERYAYLPSMGLMLIVAVAASRLQKNARPAMLLPGILIVAACVVLDVGRIRVFANGVSFNRDILLLHPNDGSTHYNLGNALQDQGNTDEAMAEYRKTMELRPDFANAYLNAGILTAEHGNIDEAIVLIHEAVLRNPQSPKVQYNLGVALEKHGEIDAAIDAYKRAIELLPEFPLAHKRLAEAYGQKRMFKEALEEYAKLAELDPAFAAQLEVITKKFGL